MGSVLSFWEDLRQKVLAIVKLRSSVGVFELAKRILLNFSPNMKVIGM